MSSASERREELKAVWQQATACTRCPQLAATRTTVVFGSGNADADLMFVGEAPGANEDKQGLPFVGQAGRLLDTLLGEIGLTRAEVFVANVLKCRPPGNRDPLPQEIDACQDYLFRQLELIEPKVVCTLGNFATKLLRADPTGITRLHGRDELRQIGPRVVRLYPLFHPAAALYTPAMLATLRADFERIPALLAKPAPEQPQPEPEPELVVPEPELVLVPDESDGRAARPVLSGFGGLRRRVLVGGDRVALVIAPLAADQQVARGEALEPEPRAARQRDRRRVAGLDVGLDPMQAERPERMVEDLLERLAHQALPGVALVRVVAEVGGLERAADDLGDREHAGDRAVFDRHRRPGTGSPRGASGCRARRTGRRARAGRSTAGAGGGSRAPARGTRCGRRARARAGRRARRAAGRGGHDLGRAGGIVRAAAEDGAFHARVNQSAPAARVAGSGEPTIRS